MVYVILGYAYALLALGDSSSLEEAERLLTEAQVVLDKLSDVRDLRAQTSIYQSIVFCRQGRFEPGLKVIDRVIASSTGIDDGYFRCCRAELLNQAGRHQEALTEAQKALTGPDVDYAGVAHEQLAIAQDALGNAADAMSEIRLALGTALAQYPVSPAVQRHLNAAARILERHNALESFRATEAAELLFEVQRAGLEGVDDEIAWDEDEEHRILAATLVQRRLEAQDNLGALASADRFRARSLAEISALPKGKLLTDTSIGHERLPLNSTLDEQITFVAETARRTLKKWGIPPPLEGADLSELIARHGRTVVLFHPTGPHLRIFTVRPETPRQIHTAVAKAAMGDIVALSEALRSQLGTMVAGRAARGDFPSQAAEELIEFPGSKISEPTNELNRLRQELYSALFSEVVHLFQRDDPIVLVPYRELSVIPFGVLTDSDGTPLIDKSPCSVLPSIASLGVLKTSETQRAHAVVLGDPLLSSAMGLDSLPWAADEAESVGAKLGSRDICTTVLTGPVATAENFRRHATGALFVHLACHAALREPASASRLFLAPSLHDDGSLLPAEIEDLRFGGALVVLSACQSGLGRATADGVLGLGRAFINAGARAVVLSLWRVGDEVTSLLMDEFYDNLLGTNGHQEHTDAAEALRRAQRKTSVSCYGDVGFWGPWILLGDGGWRLAV